MTTLYLVRHGVTSHTGKRLTGWHPGVGLTAEGAEQAEAVAEALSGVRLAAVYASPIQRAQETATPVAARQGLRVETNDGLGEVHYGEWSNRTFKSLPRTRLWAQLKRWPSAPRFPGGETLRETQARVVGAAEELRQTHRRDAICCVSHADAIKLILAHYLGIHIDLYERLALDPGSISVVTIDEGGPRVKAVNHLPRGVPE